MIDSLSKGVLLIVEGILAGERPSVDTNLESGQEEAFGQGRDSAIPNATGIELH